MATLNFYLKPSMKSAEGHLFIRITQDNQSKDLATRYRLFPHEWDSYSGSIVFPQKFNSRSKYVIDIDDQIQSDIYRFEQIVRYLELHGKYTIDDVLGRFCFNVNNNSLSSFVERLSNELIERGQERTARAYYTVARGVIRFNRSEDFRLEQISAGWIRKFECYMIDNGKSLNTISFYMRNLRAIYNKAVKEHLIIARTENPFATVHTGIYNTRKRALTKEEMNAFFELELIFSKKVKNKKMEEYIRSLKINKKILHLYHKIFMFSFHARGMSFVDVAYLKKANIKGDTIHYCRRKTGRYLRVKITEPMKVILDYFLRRNLDSPYVFPLINPKLGNERRQYENSLRTQNRMLKILGEMAGIDKKISTHVARHSWATIARRENVFISHISEALGHKDEKTTMIYLDSFSFSVIDRISDQISESIIKYY